MNYKWLIPAVLAAIILASIYYWSKDEHDDNNQNPPVEVNFRQEGNIVQNNPGLKPNVWFLIYEQPGQAALSKELDLSEINLSMTLENGMRVKIEGVETDNIVKVTTLTLLSDNNPTQSVKLYYYNPNKDKDASGNIICSEQGLVSVQRDIPVTDTPIQDTIKLLLQGKLSDAEKAQGITTEYPLAGVELKGADLKNGTLTLEFTDPENKTGGGSCRVSILWAQIQATAKQFSGVDQVKFIPEELFQP